MSKSKIKFLLDFCPLILVSIAAFRLVMERVHGDVFFQWRHIVALIFLGVTYILFIWRHKIGVLCLGLTLLLGILNLLSFSSATTILTIHTHSRRYGDSTDYYFYEQFIFGFWLICHLLVSWRHYAGISNGSYWRSLFK